MAAPLLDAARIVFEEAIAAFLAKNPLPTARWDDIQGNAHDRAAVVAGAMKADLLADLVEAIRVSVVDGGTLAEFRKTFADIVARRGWTGWTGEGTKGGEAWRTRVIHQTNVSTSYASGRWAQLTDPDLLRVRPYWRYIHSDLSLHARAHHKAWGDSGLTLPWNHPFWQTHFPPNGFGCKCSVVAVRAPGAGDAKEPPADWAENNPDTDAPPGIGKGWDYAPGASVAEELRKFVAGKATNLPPELARDLAADVNAAFASGNKGQP